MSPLLIIVLLIILGVVLAVGLTWTGGWLCYKGNALGLVLCFLGSFLLGLLIGGCLLYNHHAKKKAMVFQMQLDQLRNNNLNPNQNLNNNPNWNQNQSLNNNPNLNTNSVAQKDVKTTDENKKITL
ncbi:hypothetical protein [Mycoplasma sp. SG1]|uniref:hypothetical protein n=1 Tax=Mycoplasma sp. SG1 TaxID=2810348 RepID=UPI0020253C39|nr:hypothetical protein [Mycoplasma sp. SG1]URM52857.1 hypothetical protein JRW51_00735 [Mycoplasma sp. SG1]